MNITLSDSEKLTVALALSYWLDNVAQEDTSEDEYLEATELLERIQESIS